MGVSRRVLTLMAAGLVAGLLAVIAIGSGSGEPTAPEALASSPDCSFPEPPEHGATVLGRAHFFSAYELPGKQGDELQLNPTGKGKWFVKQALEIKGSDPVVFRVPPRSQRSVDLVGWGGDVAGGTKGSDRITIDLGASGECHGAWPGGFNITRKQCFTLKVEADDRAARVPFGLGKSCNF